MTAIRPILILCLLCVASVRTQTSRADDRAPTTDQLEFFEREVRPLLVKHCYEYHSVNAERVEANLLLESRASHLTGGDSGPAIVPGDADGSLLIEAVRYESYEMPPKGKLPDRDIHVFQRWIAMEAPWPKQETPTADVEQDEFDLEKRRSKFWGWQPIADPQTPQVNDRDWPTN